MKSLEWVAIDGSLEEGKLVGDQEYCHHLDTNFESEDDFECPFLNKIIRFAIKIQYD